MFPNQHWSLAVFYGNVHLSCFCIPSKYWSIQLKLCMPNSAFVFLKEKLFRVTEAQIRCGMWDPTTDFHCSQRTRCSWFFFISKPSHCVMDCHLYQFLFHLFPIFQQVILIYVNLSGHVVYWIFGYFVNWYPRYPRSVGHLCHDLLVHKFDCRNT